MVSAGKDLDDGVPKIVQNGKSNPKDSIQPVESLGTVQSEASIKVKDAITYEEEVMILSVETKLAGMNQKFLQRPIFQEPEVQDE